MNHDEPVVLQIYGNRIDAELAKGALEDAGIEAFVQGDTAGGMRDHLAYTGDGFHVLVRAEDATLAREVLEPPAGG